MKDIELGREIILRSQLEDMEEEHRRTAERLLFSNQALKMDVLTNRIEEGSLYGARAVRAYRDSLGYPTKAIRVIPVKRILSAIDDYNDMEDIIFFLKKIENRNRRCMRLSEIGAPDIILIHEFRQLQEAVEYLMDNSWCGNPYEVEWGDGEVTPRKSLKDLGISPEDLYS